ncbi:MAG TPA: PEP-CTERM sorting domain-containing protein [Acidobacteriaceae bacterium]|nr:PEP-CTERM sorting domain-containing protein [Acidobacteriaceae bacterium]
MRSLSIRILVASLVLFAGFGLSATANAGTVTVGNDPNNARPIVDGCNNCAYVIPTAFSQAGDIVTGISFWAGQPGDITPVLLSGHDNGDGTITFVVTGVGTDYIATSTGLNTFAFGLTSGSDRTGSNTYFGFFDVGSSTVAFDHDGSGAGTFLVGTMPGLTGSFTDSNGAQDPDTQNDLNDRLYSIEATAITTPEPTTFSLLALGISGLGAMTRFRRR